LLTSGTRSVYLTKGNLERMLSTRTRWILSPPAVYVIYFELVTLLWCSFQLVTFFPLVLKIPLFFRLIGSRTRVSKVLPLRWALCVSWTRTCTGWFALWYVSMLWSTTCPIELHDNLVCDSFGQSNRYLLRSSCTSKIVFPSSLTKHLR
jgi:hypothetical protein